MKLYTELKSLALAAYRDFTGVFIGTRFAIDPELVLRPDDPAVQRQISAGGPDFYVRLDRLIKESELADFTAELRLWEKLPLKGIVFSDLAVLALIEREDWELVYNAPTLVASQAEVAAWNARGVVPVVSSDLTAEELAAIAESSDKQFIYGLGRLLLFYSGRPLAQFYTEDKASLATGFSALAHGTEEALFVTGREGETFIYSAFIYDCLATIADTQGGMIIGSKAFTEEELAELARLIHRHRFAEIKTRFKTETGLLKVKTRPAVADEN